MKKVLNVIYCLVILLIVAGLIYQVDGVKESSNKNYTLVIDGDNIVYKNKIFVEKGGLYLPFNTVKKVIDEDIFFDDKVKKLIVTTENEVVKFEDGKNKKQVNLKEKECKNPFLIKEDIPYVPVTELKELYGLEIVVNEDNKMVSINNKKDSHQKVLENGVKLYSKLDTKSKVLENIKLNDEIIVYGEEKLKHPRWIKVTTRKGNTGYIFRKTNLAIEDKNVAKKEEAKENKSKEKVVMFWQQGNSLEVLGDKKDVINVASPDWFDIISNTGDIKEKIDESYFARAKAYGYKVWPMFSNVNTEGAKELTSKLLNSEASRERLIKNILSIVDKYRLDGVNLDFENMKDEEKHLYTEFIRELAPLLRERKVTLSCDVYFVKYIERDRVAKAVDYVMLMGYDQHWNNSPVSGSVAEISWVEKNINYLLNDFKVKPEKLILGIPFYTRLWEENGAARPKSTNLSLESQEAYIKRHGLTKTWDAKAGQNYVEYQKGNKVFKMWVEDEKSIKQRVELVNKYNLAGIAAWQKRFDTDYAWQTIKDNLK